MVESSLIKRILQDIKEIPPLPEVATRVLQLTNDPEVSAAELNQVISRDEALTANVLKLCNSAYYGLPRVISSVSQAIMYLGFQTVRNMVLSSAVNQVFIKHDLSIYNYRKNGISDHSFAVAVACQTIARKLRPGLSDTAFTSGLLHDVGKIILGKYLRENDQVLQQRSASPIVTRALELEFFGMDHAQVGSHIADNWNFPQELTLAIGFHHNPDEAKGRPLLAVITYLADIVCLRLGVGLNNPGIHPPISDYCFEATGYSDDTIDELCKEVQEALQATTKSSDH
ncbi:HDOD domain-containing protein [bacterium]|nr:MAG: Ribonuclease Y [Candidatus Hinthialibacteria bacterium OLB16]MCK6495640.1 HDOD domain-containing protein [bacterium]NUP92043.1 HDOD domain-containing protein [Candidatus Omnitrophota bacterium]